jgi:hypothetical protein
LFFDAEVRLCQKGKQVEIPLFFGVTFEGLYPIYKRHVISLVLGILLLSSQPVV